MEENEMVMYEEAESEEIDMVNEDCRVDCEQSEREASGSNGSLILLGFCAASAACGYAVHKYVTPWAKKKLNNVKARNASRKANKAAKRGKNVEVDYEECDKD